MSEIRTLNDLQDWLDRDIAWRIKEISSVKSSLRSDSGAGRYTKAMVRAGVALLYAHWEGFIKTASETYLEFISNQRLEYVALKPCFIVFGLKRELSFIEHSKKHAKNTRAVEFILQELTKTANLSYRGVINTGANLSSEVFTAIAESIGIEISSYSTKFALIDESLLKRRNRIAHGEYLDIGASEFDSLGDDVINLLRTYKTDIENSASLQSYRV
jgi:MAE_28990/MAE_18760-like HEPN